MISSAALAIVVGIFIGWEEKIVGSLIEGSASIQDTVQIFSARATGKRIQRADVQHRFWMPHGVHSCHLRSLHGTWGYGG